MKASGWMMILLLIAVVGIGGFAWYRFESEAPGPEIEPLAVSIRSTARRHWVL